MDRRVGIVTFHRAHNSGAMLQAYALHRVVSSLGCACFFVDDPGGVRGSRAWPAVKTARDLVAYPARFLNMLGVAQLKAARFNAFRTRFLPEKPLVLADAGLSDAVDVLVVGSDQVWNPLIGYRTKPVYLLEGVSPGVRKVSYAASFGVSRLPEDQEGRYRKALSAFDAISVREDAGAHIVEGLLGERPPVVLDPTMLLSAEDYAEVEAPVLKRGAYVFSYCPSENEGLYRFSRRIAKSLGLPLVSVQNGRMGYLGCHWGDWRATSPDRFLSLVRRSACVVTDSFHASVFSILYGRPFWTCRDGCSKGFGSRLETLLSSLGLCDHYVESTRPLPASTDEMGWNVGAVRARLDGLRRSSLDFLRKELTA